MNSKSRDGQQTLLKLIPKKSRIKVWLRKVSSRISKFHLIYFKLQNIFCSSSYILFFFSFPSFFPHPMTCLWLDYSSDFLACPDPLSVPLQWFSALTLQDQTQGISGRQTTGKSPVQYWEVVASWSEDERREENNS